ncbi:MAG: adenylyl-sulfate kinase, partial [Rhodococcus sp. (in: high G+C Gram-positive bacteria)]
PGHVQYTRNMVTGASTADLALILVDARHGILEQTKRHAFLSSLLGIPHLVLCINKMDLVGWSQQRYEDIRDDFRTFAAKLEVPDLTFVPMSALDGDNVVHRTTKMPWYEGSSLLHHLEDVHIASDRNLIDARFPVQYVVRPKGGTGEHADFRGYTGTVASGVFKPGDEVVVLPSGFTSRISAVWGPGGEKIDEGFAQAALCIELVDDIDVARGDMLCRPNNRPLVGGDIDAMMCWLTDDAQLRSGDRYLLMHTTATTVATVEQLDYRLNVDTLHRDEEAESLTLNDIGRVRIRTTNPLLFDPYRRNRITGSFLLVDEASGATVAAGMISGPALSASKVVWHSSRLARVERATAGGTVWLTGLSGSGKSTVAAELERLLVASGRPAYLLDGDNLRHGLNSDLAFDRMSRAENVRRVGAVAQLMADAGLVAVTCLISPYRDGREAIRIAHEKAGLPFYEVFVDTPLEVCESRDPKGMYAKARAGEITGFTGIDDPYDAPLHPDLLLRPSDGDPTAQAARIVELLRP